MSVFIVGLLLGTWFGFGIAAFMVVVREEDEDERSTDDIRLYSQAKRSDQERNQAHDAVLDKFTAKDN